MSVEHDAYCHGGMPETKRRELHSTKRVLHLIEYYSRQVSRLMAFVFDVSTMRYKNTIFAKQSKFQVSYISEIPEDRMLNSDIKVFITVLV
jgi:hypothetical protein